MILQLKFNRYIIQYSMYNIRQCCRSLNDYSILNCSNLWLRKISRSGIVPQKLLLKNNEYQKTVSSEAVTHYQHYSDKVDIKNNSSIYYGILTPQIKAVKLFSLCTSLGGLAAQPVLLQKASYLGGIPLIALFSFVGFFTFVTPGLLHWITKKYVTEMNYNSDNEMYTATTYTFFLRKKMITFSCNDVKVPEVPGMFTTFQVKGESFFIDAGLFEEPVHFARIMGYDKPIDFKLEKCESDTSKSPNKKHCQ